jgi:CTP synthase
MIENAKTIYEVPLKLYKEGTLKQIYSHFNIQKKNKIKLGLWEKFLKKFNTLKHNVNVAIVGKYTNLSESYKSLNEALFHSGIYNNSTVNISWIDSRKLKTKKNTEKILKLFDGILVPGGFGKDGAEGKINAIKFAKLYKIPFLGICFGMQLAILESVRNLKGYENSSSTEFGPTKKPIISMMNEWQKNNKIFKQDLKNLGGSMRLGSYESILLKNTLIEKIYKKCRINERHRHRYEVNYNYLDVIKRSGVVLSGLSPDKKLVEVMEIKNHPWFIGVQFHPELKSTPFKPHPIFNSFINALIKKKNKK